MCGSKKEIQGAAIANDGQAMIFSVKKYDMGWIMDQICLELSGIYPKPHSGPVSFQECLEFTVSDFSVAVDVKEVIARSVALQS